MTRVAAINSVGVGLILALAILGGRPRDGAMAWVGKPRASGRTSMEPVRMPDGRLAVADASAHLVPLSDLRRIVSASFIADRLLFELADPDRIAALTSYGSEHARDRNHYVGKPLVRGLDDIEGLVALAPDLVLVSNFGDPRRLARLREAGIEVFDLGEMRGLRTLIPNIGAVATLLGKQDEGARLAASFMRRMNSVASDVTPARRRTAAYLSVSGTQLLGATVGTGYHDVLVHAGLIDAAAGRFRDWLHYRTEDVLALDPDVIVTRAGIEPLVCRHPGLERLRVCRGEGTVVGLPGDLLGDPGLPILDAAEELRVAVYGEPPTTERSE